MLFGIFVLFGAIVGLLVYDTNTNGGGVFEKSTVGKLLKDTGALPHVEKAFTFTMKHSARGYKWTEKNVPVYYNSTCKVSRGFFFKLCHVKTDRKNSI